MGTTTRHSIRPYRGPRGCDLPRRPTDGRQGSRTSVFHQVEAAAHQAAGRSEAAGHTHAAASPPQSYAPVKGRGRSKRMTIRLCGRLRSRWTTPMLLDSPPPCAPVRRRRERARDALANAWLAALQELGEIAGERGWPNQTHDDVNKALERFAQKDRAGRIRELKLGIVGVLTSWYPESQGLGDLRAALLYVEELRQRLRWLAERTVA